MRTPLTPIFPVENKKLIEEVSVTSDNIIVDEKVKRQVKQVFETELAKETSKNRISVGKSDVLKKVLTYYCPHNCRVYFDFDKKNFDVKKPMSYIGCSY
jgi:hypothetical protein